MPAVLAPKGEPWWTAVLEWLGKGDPASPPPDGTYRKLWQSLGPIYQPWAHVPTMLTVDEMQLLYWLARDCYTGRGSIVDCGCFLGGSTSSLCAGLQANPHVKHKQGRVHVYDRFTYEAYFRHWFLCTFARDQVFAEGETFLPLYQSLNQQYQDFMEVHPGDILEVRPPAGSIEILFIDVCKSWDINNWVTKHLFSRLIPRRSLIVQQDYYHYFPHWLVLTMDYFRDCFVQLDPVEDGHSALFQLVKPLPRERLNQDPKHLPLAWKKEAFERAVDRAVGWQRNEILIGYYRMLLEAEDEAGAREMVRRIPPEAESHPINKWGMPSIWPEHKVA